MDESMDVGIGRYFERCTTLMGPRVDWRITVLAFLSLRSYLHPLASNIYKGPRGILSWALRLLGSFGRFITMPL